MRRRLLVLSTLTLVLLSFLCSESAFATHPLITDDANTQGKGNFQLEINGQYGHDKGNDGVVQNTTPAGTTLTYGIIDPVDVIVGIPYEWIQVKESQTTSHQSGISDAPLAIKWRFYENDGLSFALKPGITLPTGDQDKHLGTGKMTYSLFFITTKKIKPWAFHVNLGYIGNENKLDQRVPLYHASVAAELEVIKNLKIVANTGIQRNTQKGTHTDPAFVLGGLVYSITENLDIDAGYKYGITEPEVDHTVLVGLTFRF